jgi:hypothetical protein
LKTEATSSSETLATRNVTPEVGSTMFVLGEVSKQLRKLAQLHVRPPGLSAQNSWIPVKSGTGDFHYNLAAQFTLSLKSDKNN